MKHPTSDPISFPLCLRAPLAWLTLATLITGPLHTQSPPRLALGPPTSTTDPEFQRLVSARELSDGRLILLEPQDRHRKLMILNMTTGEVRTVGRIGSGPNEYRNPGSLAPLAGDTTLINDTELRRWLLMVGTTIRGTIAGDNPVVQAVGRRFFGGDTLGRVLGLVGDGATGPMPILSAAQARSALVVLANIADRSADTLVRLRGGDARLQNIVLVRPEVAMNAAIIVANPLRVPDQALLFPDGWIAVAYQSPYRVDWRTPAGHWVRGQELSGRQPPLTEADKRAAMSLLFGGMDSRRTPTTVFPDWPEMLPPFPEDALLALPTGHLLIRRVNAATESGALYDVVSRNGRVAAIITLSAAERIIGAGARGIYVTAPTGDGLHVLRRHPLPQLGPDLRVTLPPR